jgi:hypothetical protein
LVFPLESTLLLWVKEVWSLPNPLQAHLSYHYIGLYQVFNQ